MNKFYIETLWTHANFNDPCKRLNAVVHSISIGASVMHAIALHNELEFHLLTYTCEHFT